MWMRLICIICIWQQVNAAHHWNVIKTNIHAVVSPMKSRRLKINSHILTWLIHIMSSDIQFKSIIPMTHLFKYRQEFDKSTHSIAFAFFFFSISIFLYFVPRMARNESGLVCMDFVHNPWWTCVQTRLSINTKSDIFMWTSIWEYMTTIAGINLFDVAFMRKLDERLIN